MEHINLETDAVMLDKPFLNKHDGQIYEICELVITGVLTKRCLVLVNLTKQTIETDWNNSNDNDTELFLKELLPTDVNLLYYVDKTDSLTNVQKSALAKWAYVTDISN